MSASGSLRPGPAAKLLASDRPRFPKSGGEELMTGALAVFTNDLGASFIDRHLSDLAPGRTVAVGRYGAVEFGNIWKTVCPELLLDRWTLGLPVRLAKRAGVSEKS